ncbi:malate dehydrogenase (quinone) [Aestuariirhabdus litorea]|uniref:Probable malate:quinone oxidoreductase n=1 Tax=Aestuariirhabdus litorea TaxID=2528527 RepID=A0A3P3VSY8_9GAMM|nr:malate dehydrogenase (quinone) [Aestuariirhabdus litorea]RRJ84806.1 malate dehydrogenase (quinone) [Aestuariirhabdus litorea]RWW98030.1 malate dehydrogenase (quinone) [Endozoicomonadaceae bacterium GTF-13]
MKHDIYDALLVGSGTMSTTLATLLKQLDPALRIAMVEALDDVALESTAGWNNAGTGHAAYCELNYTPQNNDGNVEISKALGINAAFELSLQFWSYLVENGDLPTPSQFINPTPHCSFVWGEKNVAFLRKRYELMSAHHLFKGMEYSEDPQQIEQWMPLVMEGRDTAEPVAATRMKIGSDVDFGALTRAMINNLNQTEGFELMLGTRVTHLQQEQDGHWQVRVRNNVTGENEQLTTRFIFLGAGGATLPLLQKSGIKESRGYGGFPVSGQWLVCKDPAVVEAHSTKVYGKAALGAPPMSVPHLDTRLIDGKKALLFGPFAGFTTKFLKQGSIFDMPASVRSDNLRPLLSVGAHNMDLTRYLIKEALQSHHSRMESLRQYLPNAKDEDWELATAGQRVQVIKRASDGNGSLEFGTEMVASEDGSLAALLGASPGASIAVQAMLNVLTRCFSSRMQSESWQQKLSQMIPSYGVSLTDNPEHLQQLRPRTLRTLGLLEAGTATTQPAEHSVSDIAERLRGGRKYDSLESIKASLGSVSKNSRRAS